MASTPSSAARLQRSIQQASLATVIGLLPHYALALATNVPVWTEAVAEWIMARTPNHWSMWILGTFGAWAKPFAVTGGLATLGFGVWVIAAAVTVSRGYWWRLLTALFMAAVVGTSFGWWFEYPSFVGQWAFWLCAALASFSLVELWPVAIVQPAAIDLSRRTALATIGRVALPVVMSSGTVAVALESYWRERRLAEQAVRPVPLYPFNPPPERFVPNLVRTAVTPTEPVDRFYYMSKNAVDPIVDPQQYRLRITIDGQPLRTYTFAELLAFPRTARYQTLRCISNTLQTDLMSTASWSGIHLAQLVRREDVPADIIEAAFIGLDGHDDSVPLGYAFSDDTLLALGMNGKTLNRTHGFPIRLLVPRYYGCKNIKWIGEIRFVRKPYFGTWPKMGYTKEPTVHVASHVDGVQREQDSLLVAGVSFAGDRGIQRVQVRVNDGPWIEAECEPHLDRFTWRRWQVRLPFAASGIIEARAQDGRGHWQEAQEGPMFPGGIPGPTKHEFSV